MANYHKMKYEYATAATVEQARNMAANGAGLELVVWIEPDGTIIESPNGQGFYLGAVTVWNKV